MTSTLDTNGKKSPVYKVVVVGDAGTGKTSIVNRYMHGAFDRETAPTIAVDFAVKNVVVVGNNDDQQQVRLQVWDVAGQDRFSALSSQFFRGAHAVIVVFDATRRGTFVDCATWRARVAEQPRPEGVGEPLYILCENKRDLLDDDASRSVVDEIERDALVDERDYADCCEVSAKTGDNVDAMFKYVARQLWQRHRREFIASVALDNDADGTVSLGDASIGTREYVERRLAERHARSSCAC